MEQVRRDPVGIGKETINGFRDDDGTGLAAEAAYRLVFALPALAIFFASLSGVAAQYTGVDAFQMLLNEAEDALPDEAFSTMEMVFDTAQDQSGFGLLSVGLLIALWSGSNAMAAIVKAINRAFSMTDRRSFIRARLVALGLTVGLSILMIVSFVLLVFGEQIGNALAGSLGYGDVFTLVWNILRWPVLLALFISALAILYWQAPAEDMDRSTILPGALFVTLLWLIIAYGFGIYLSVADPGSAYGVIGGILVLLLFLYLTSIAIIVGAELNAALFKRTPDAEGAPAPSSHPVDVATGVRQSETQKRPVAGSKIGGWIVLVSLFTAALVARLVQTDENDPTDSRDAR